MPDTLAIRRAASPLVLGNTLLHFLFDALNGDRTVVQARTATGADFRIHTTGPLADFDSIVTRSALNRL
jgi:hypothetical protein